MKNTFIALFISFSAIAFSQEKKSVAKAAAGSENIAVSQMSPEEIGKKNLTDLAAFTTLTTDQKGLLLELFTTKATLMADSSQFSEERKAVVAQSITYKMESVLSPDAMAKVRTNKTLFNSLVN